MGEILKRSQVPVSDTWNTKDLFHTLQDWEEAYAPRASWVNLRR